MTLIASLLFVSLLAVALVHLAWALGSEYPVGEEKLLARTVAGFRGIGSMPPRLITLAVAVAVFLCGLWAFVLTGAITGFPEWMVIWGGSKMVLLFGARGILGYTPWWRRLTPARWHRRPGWLGQDNADRNVVQGDARRVFGRGYHQ